MGSQDNALQQWLTDNGLSEAPRIATRLKIEDGWEFAVEQVIGRFTQGLSLPCFDPLTSALEQGPRGLAIVSENGGTGAGTGGLAAKVSGVDRKSTRLNSSHVRISY